MDKLLSKDQTIISTIAENEQLLRQLFNPCYDITYRSFAPPDGLAVLMVYISGLIDRDKINNECLMKIKN